MEKNKNKKDSFIFYRSFYEVINDLDEKNQLLLFKAIAELSLNDNEIKLDGILKTIFKLIKPQIEANNKRFVNGSKGGRPKKNNGSEILEPKVIEEDNQIESTDLQDNKPNNNQNETKTKPNKNVNDNDNVNVNNNKNKKENPKEKNQTQKIEVREIQYNDWESLFDYWEQNKKGGNYKSKESRKLMLDRLKTLTNNDFNYALEAIKFAVGNNYQGFCNGGELFYKPPKNNLTTAIQDDEIELGFKKATDPAKKCSVF